MPKTIRSVLESLNRGEYRGKGGVNAAIVEIREILREIEPECPDVYDDTDPDTAFHGAVIDYTANIEKRLG